MSKSIVPVVTYEDMNKSRTTFQEARESFRITYYHFLSTILTEVGFNNKLVRLKRCGTLGQFQVYEDQYSARPWVIKFFPCKKSDGHISMKSKYLHDFTPWNEQTLAQQLKDIAEVVGDLP